MVDARIRAAAERIATIVETWPPWSTGDEFYADDEVRRLTDAGDSKLISAAIDYAEGLGRITTVRLRYKHDADGGCMVIFYMAAGYELVSLTG